MVNELDFPCSSCGAKLRLPNPDAWGKRIKCPKCGTTIVAGAVNREAETVHDDEEDDAPAAAAPRKKKSKSQGKKKKAGGSNAGLIAGGALAALVLVGGLLVLLFAGKSKPFAVPQSFGRFNGSTFAIELPKEWTLESGGANGHEWASSKQSDMLVKVKEDLIGSLMGDLAGGPLADGGNAVELAPVHNLHLSKAEGFKEDYDQYAEGPPEVVKSKLGDARRSEFNATKGWGKVKGYRVTVQGNTRTWTILCECPEKHWEAMKSVFARLIDSMAHPVPK